MNREELEKIFDEKKAKWDGDNTFQGLLIISKYFDIKNKNILGAAEHDIIYSVRIDEALQAGLTTEDAEALAKLNWMISEFDCFACFV
jgi:hypothetical protein